MTQVYHLIDRKTGKIIKYWIYGISPKEIEKRLGKYDKRSSKLILVKDVEKYQTMIYNKKHKR